jgi:hypothetical protein
MRNSPHINTGFQPGGEWRMAERQRRSIIQPRVGACAYPGSATPVSSTLKGFHPRCETLHNRNGRRLLAPNKAPEGWRTPRRWRDCVRPSCTRSVLECGGPPPLSDGTQDTVIVGLSSAQCLPIRFNPFRVDVLPDYTPRVAPTAQPWADGFERRWRSPEFYANQKIRIPNQN